MAGDYCGVGSGGRSKGISDYSVIFEIDCGRGGRIADLSNQVADDRFGHGAAAEPLGGRFCSHGDQGRHLCRCLLHRQGGYVFSIGGESGNRIVGGQVGADGQAERGNHSGRGLCGRGAGAFDDFLDQGGQGRYYLRSGRRLEDQSIRNVGIDVDAAHRQDGPGGGIGGQDELAVGVGGHPGQRLSHIGDPVVVTVNVDLGTADIAVGDHAGAEAGRIVAGRVLQGVDVVACGWIVIVDGNSSAGRHAVGHGQGDTGPGYRYIGDDISSAAHDDGKGVSGRNVGSIQGLAIDEDDLIARYRECLNRRGGSIEGEAEAGCVALVASRIGLSHLDVVHALRSSERACPSGAAVNRVLHSRLGLSGDTQGVVAGNLIRIVGAGVARQCHRRGRCRGVEGEAEAGRIALVASRIGLPHLDVVHALRSSESACPSSAAID